ncbi:chitinase [Kitasatospora sp. NPDC101183]|uniref:chitinase n=1 Tax=Kitasatospora sp. NPDC101183 TaxID=3364100 RepID=UPI0038167528
MKRQFVIRQLVTIGTVCLTLSASTLAGVGSAAPQGEEQVLEAVPGSGAFAPYVPYVDSSLSSRPNLAALAANSGAKQFAVTLIVAGSDNRTPVWNTDDRLPVSGNFMVPEINELRRAGGDVVVSFGGADTNDLAQGIKDVGQLVATYRSVIDRLQADKVEFDIERGTLADDAANDRRSQAVARLQAEYAREGRTLHTMYTLPAQPDGLTPEGLRVLRGAVAHHVRVDRWNLMALNYRQNPGTMGTAAITASEGLHEQLSKAYKHADRDRLWHRIGVTTMIGVNVSAGQVFGREDAQQLLRWARAKHMGLLSFWQIQRDHPCAAGTLSMTCSGVPEQAEYEFSSVFRQLDA